MSSAPPVGRAADGRAETASFRPPFVPLQALARWASALLIASITLAWVAVGVDASKIYQLAQAARGENVELAERMARWQVESFLFWVRGGLFAASALTFVAWLYQARVNLRSFGARRLRYARSWVINGFLVPLLNLLRPYQVTREIWQASDPANLDAFQWRSAPIPTLLRSWWSATAAAALLELLSVLVDLGSGTSLARLRLAALVSLVAHACVALSAFLSTALVSRLSDLQQAKWERLQGPDRTPA